MGVGNLRTSKHLICFGAFSSTKRIRESCLDDLQKVPIRQIEKLVNRSGDRFFYRWDRERKKSHIYRSRVSTYAWRGRGGTYFKLGRQEWPGEEKVPHVRHYFIYRYSENEHVKQVNPVPIVYNVDAERLVKECARYGHENVKWSTRP